MKSIYVDIRETNLKFYLFERDLVLINLNKLKNLGLPDFSIQFPAKIVDDFFKTPDGLYRKGDFYCNSISPMTAVDGAIYSASFEPKDNSINVELKGIFFARTPLRMKSLKTCSVGLLVTYPALD